MPVGMIVLLALIAIALYFDYRPDPHHDKRIDGDPNTKHHLTR